MLATLVPLFDENIRVKSYSLFCQKKNFLLEPQYMGTFQFNAVNIDGFDMINTIGLDTLASDAEVFVPVTNISLLGDIVSQCQVDPSRIVLLMNKTITPEDTYIERIKKLKAEGFKFAIRKLDVSDFEPYKPILALVDYVILNHQKIVISKAKIYFKAQYPNVQLVAGNIQTMEEFEALKAEGGYQFYEGGFYRMPVTKGDTEVAPLKINYIDLMNVVNKEDFDLDEAADIIGRDTALVISLLDMVNKMARNSEITSIRHAAAMLGQKELRKWITTAITKQLCADRPSEITRVSLLRARFAENLAQYFGMKAKSGELFLMGLFSVIDLILNQPMEEALEKVNVSKEIREALMERKGDFARILQFMEDYEDAHWQEISRIMVLENIDMNSIYEAYKASLEWYRDLFGQAA